MARLLRGVAVSAAAVGLGAVALAVVRGLGVARTYTTYAAYWRERATRDGELLHVALGDSTAQAVGAADPDDGYVGRLAADLRAATGRTVQVVNVSATGARVADLVEKQLPELRRLLEAGRTPALVTVTIGANDTGRTPVAAFEVSMRLIVEALPAGARVADVPWFHSKNRDRDGDAFSAVIRRLVAERGDLVQVDLRDATRTPNRNEYAADWFHPNARGYLSYYRAFASAAPLVAPADSA